MARHFGPQHMHNFYAGLGGHMKRPRYAGATGRSVADSIAREKAKALRAANIKKKA